MIYINNNGTQVNFYKEIIFHHKLSFYTFIRNIKSGMDGSRKKKEPKPIRTGPGSTYDAVPELVKRHLHRYGNRIDVDMDTFRIKVIAVARKVLRSYEILKFIF